MIARHNILYDRYTRLPNESLPRAFIDKLPPVFSSVPHLLQLLALLRWKLSHPYRVDVLPTAIRCRKAYRKLGPTLCDSAKMRSTNAPS
jgi:hypothetical protein